MPATRNIVWGVVCLLPLLTGAARGAETLDVGGRTYVVIGECQQPTYSIKMSLMPPIEQGEQTGLSVLFGADEQGNGYRFEADARGWVLKDISAGRTGTLARGGRALLPSADPVTLVIKRRDWLLTVAANGRALAEVADASHFAGLAAVDPMLSSPAGEPVVQDVGELNFQDEFMRPQDDLNLDSWDIAAGKWQLHSVRQDSQDMPWRQRPASKQPESRRSANPFSVSGHADGTGLLTTKGFWFWDDFRAACSVRNTGAEAVGLAFNITSPDDYFVLAWDRWSPVLEPTRIRLLRVSGGSTAELATAWLNAQLDQWYKLEVRTCGQQIRAFVDEAPVLAARHAESLGGKLGLYVTGGDEKHAGMFDDIVLSNIRGYDYDDKVWLARHLAGHDGRWFYKRVERPARPANYAAVLGGTDGRVILGHAGWGAPVVSARLSVPAIGQALGLAAGLGAGDGEGLRAVLSRGRNGPELLLQRTGAAGEALARCGAFDLPDDGFVELKLDLSRPGESNVYLDGRLVLHAPRGEAGHGAVAIFGRGFPGAEFRDLRIAFQRDEDVERQPRRELFAADPFMKHWSSPEGAWWPADSEENKWWHVGDFYGRSDVTIPFKPGIVFIHAAVEVSRDTGYALVQEKVDPPEGTQGTFYRLTLLRNGQAAASATVSPPPPETVEEEQVVAGATARAPAPVRLVFHKENPYLWVTVAGEEVLTFRDPEPLRSPRVALIGLASSQLPQLELYRNHVRDCYFQTAATDWHCTGEWKVTTRFACDPRWSFMAGLATQNAVLSSKYRYEGDITLEAYMGMRMDTRGRGTYVRVGDFNFALCRRPQDMDSGYNFVVAGWDRAVSDLRSYLLKGTERLRETTERLLPNVRRQETQTRVLAVPWISRGRDIHGAWYYIKARKHGNELASYVDNHLVYKYEDPDPIGEYTPAVWTYSADVVVARVKVSYEKMTVPGRLVSPPGQQEAPEMPEALAPMIVSATHPGFVDDFEAGQRGWATYGQQSGVLRIVRSSLRGGGNCLRVTNPGPGGLFEAVAPVKDALIRPAGVRRLSFDYRLEPGVKINLYFTVNQQYYYIHLNGPDESNPFYLRLGELPAKADGAWHRAEFPLGAAFRDTGGGSGQMVRMVFGNLHRGPLQMGLGGNDAGLSYELDNVEVISGGGADFQAVCRGSDVPAGAQVLAVVDDRVATTPTAAGPLAGTAERPGLWTCHARVKFEDGYLGPVAHLPFVVATRPLRLEAVEPLPGRTWDYGPVELRLGAPDSPRIAPDSLALQVNGRPVATQPGLFGLDWQRNRLSIDLKNAEVQVPDDRRWTLELSYTDELGNPGTFRSDYGARHDADRTPPGPIELLGNYKPDDFESDLCGWQASPGVALMRDSSSAPAGGSSLMIQNQQWRGTFLAYPLREKFSLGRYPIIEFDYQIPQGVMLDMVVSGIVGQITVGLSDRSKSGRYVGEVPEFAADGDWHRAEFNMLAGVKTLPYRRGLFSGDWMAIGDFGGYRANALGAYWRVDNFRLVPLISGARPQELRWRCRDASGIKGYSYLWSTKRLDEPDELIDTGSPSALFQDLPSPDAFFHVKACDMAGNWGPTGHFRFVVDAAAPEAARLTPADGQRAAGNQVSVVLRDDRSAVDPETLLLAVRGRQYRPYSKGMTYDPGAGTLSWNWLSARPAAERSIPDGSTVQMELTAQDFAGNPLPPHRWHWVMDYSKDNVPPTRPIIKSTSLAVSRLDDFSSGIGQWHNKRGNMGANLRHVLRDKANQDYCLELRPARGNSQFEAVAAKQPYNLQKFPHLGFDCRIPQGVKVNLQVQINRVWREVKLTAPKATYPLLQPEAAVQAGDQWQHVDLNLLELARKVQPRAGQYVVSMITLGDLARSGNDAKAKWYVDNFLISGYGTKRAAFTWRSEDITGIGGYAVTFDRKLDTAPARVIATDREAGIFGADQPGTYWLHVMPCDNNGNWGHVRRMPYPVAAP